MDPLVGSMRDNKQEYKSHKLGSNTSYWSDEVASCSISSHLR